jgi:hypothetical protein
MATSNPTDCRQSDPESPAAEDRIVESGVLGFILGEHPAQLTLPELALAMNRDRNDFAADDEVERAIRELIGAGLIYLVSDVVLPTRAALYFDSLGVD